jgi:ABC-type Fe3+-hydroxamate transport system substrate-binding protein
MFRELRAMAIYGALLGVVLLGTGAVYLSGRRGAAAVPAMSAAAPGGKVIALSLAAEEIIIGLDGPDRLAAVSLLTLDPRYSNVVGEAARVPAVVSGTSIERILRLAPRLVMVSPYTDPSARGALERYGVRLLRLPDFTSFASIREGILLIGKALELEGPAARMVAEMDRRVAAARARVPAGRTPPRVLRYDPADAWVAGSGTVIDEVIRLAGAVNVAAENGVAGTRPVRNESVARWNPEVLLVEGDPRDRAAIAARIRGEAVLQPVAAVRRALDGGLAVVPTRTLTAVSQHAAEAVEALVDQLYPGAGR